MAYYGMKEYQDTFNSIETLQHERFVRLAYDINDALKTYVIRYAYIQNIPKIQ